MIYYFVKYQTIVATILKYFNIDITLFDDYQRLVIILLANILGLLIIWFVCSLVYKVLCRFFRIFRL